MGDKPIKKKDAPAKVKRQREAKPSAPSPAKAKKTEGAPRPAAAVARKAEAKREAEAEAEEEEVPKQKEMTGDISVRPTQTTKVATNRQRCLVLGSKNMTYKDRHMLRDLMGLMPHSRSHSKLDSRSDLGDTMKDICSMHHCNTVMLLEARKKGTSFLWLAQVPQGPSVKFLLSNIHTADELRMIGNSLKYSRPLLHFDKEFETHPHLRVMMALLSTIFNTPRYHPKSKPFIDHQLSFYWLDGHIWFRNYQILGNEAKGEKRTLSEIGPRFSLEPVVLLNGSFSGAVLWKNAKAQSPSAARLSRKHRMLHKMEENERVKDKSVQHKKKHPAPADDPLAKVFQ